MLVSLLFSMAQKETTSTNHSMVDCGLKVISVTDCFELFIENPTDLMSKAASWSSYKHHNTVKFMVSVTSHGAVSFILWGYGG